MIAYNDCGFERVNGGYLLKAKPASDMVVDALSGVVVSNAVYLAEEIDGDFTISARVSHEFRSTYDACCLIAYANDSLWSKACFECTEGGDFLFENVRIAGKAPENMRFGR